MTRVSAAPYTNMHDFILAKEIVDSVLKIAEEKKLKNIKSINVEIGNIALAHDGFKEHMEDISLKNLEFGLRNIAKNTILKNTGFNVKKTGGSSWKITEIEV